MLSIASRNAAGTSQERETTKQPVRPTSNEKPHPTSDAATGTPHPTPPVAGENRSAPRRPAAAVPSITGLRISPRGVSAVLINISTSGLLAECSERLQTGSKVTVLFDGGFVPPSAEGRVARNSVSSMSPSGRLQYHVGIAFTKPIALEEEPKSEIVEIEPAATPAAPPATASIVRNRW
jgi:hypothetical protein